MTPSIASIYDVHATWAWVVIVGNGLAGLWVLTANKIPALRTRALWWFVIFAEASIVIQVLLGVSMLLFEHRRAPFFHYFYGIVATITVCLLFAYKTRLRRRLYLLYGIGGLFLMGLGIRAVMQVVM